MLNNDVRVGPAPCKDCPDRFLGCHDHCEKYIAWTTRRKEIARLDYEFNKQEQRLNQYEYDRKRTKKYRGQGGKMI